MSPSYRMAFAVALFCTLNIIITETYFLDDLKPQIMHNYVMDKRASNLGGRFNVGKKFVGYTWLRGGDMRQRRDYMYRPEFIAPRSPLEKQRYHQTDGVKQLPMWME
ncbi:uncharacterized protein isoform X2 [Rhodnius prolixus]|uniref:uncharacterized protein isoform X2 n=1 Tax=Rhodnius prolixus TaxID=13249 RepID=UPI003D18B549